MGSKDADSPASLGLARRGNQNLREDDFATSFLRQLRFLSMIHIQGEKGTPSSHSYLPRPSSLPVGGEVLLGRWVVKGCGVREE